MDDDTTRETRNLYTSPVDTNTWWFKEELTRYASEGYTAMGALERRCRLSLRRSLQIDDISLSCTVDRAQSTGKVTMYTIVLYVQLTEVFRFTDRYSKLHSRYANLSCSATFPPKRVLSSAKGKEERARQLQKFFEVLFSPEVKTEEDKTELESRLRQEFWGRRELLQPPSLLRLLVHGSLEGDAKTARQKSMDTPRRPPPVEIKTAVATSASSSVSASTESPRTRSV